MVLESPSQAVIETGSVCNGRFQIGARLGAGVFGEVYEGVDVESGGKVAIKIEAAGAKPSLLERESKWYVLANGGFGIGKYYWSGVESDQNVMVMELLGVSLGDLVRGNGGKLPLKTVLLLGDQIIGRLEFLHGHGILHRDIKPDNFVMGLENTAHVLHVIDLGLAKLYRNRTTRAHAPWKDGKALTGNARYASLNVHDGIESSRRDDIEMASYLLVSLTRGSLPWQGIPGIQDMSKEERYKAVAEKKRQATMEEICSGCPPEFAEILRYARNLEFEERPDYNYIRRLIMDVLYREGYKYDWQYQWDRPLRKQMNSPKALRRAVAKKGKCDGDLNDLLSSTTIGSPPVLKPPLCRTIAREKPKLVEGWR